MDFAFLKLFLQREPFCKILLWCVDIQKFSKTMHTTAQLCQEFVFENFPRPKAENKSFMQAMVDLKESQTSFPENKNEQNFFLIFFSNFTILFLIKRKK